MTMSIHPNSECPCTLHIPSGISHDYAGWYRYANNIPTIVPNQGVYVPTREPNVKERVQRTRRGRVSAPLIGGGVR